MWNCDYNGVGYGAGYGHWFFGGGIIGFAITGLIITIIAVLIFKLLKANQGNSSGNLDKNDSLMILKMKFAKGEISEEEYQNKKEILSTN
ncbi:MAG: SHOCT domain-containing protein [Proteobacteria bacterium]|nr:SHOCT domain-containing protein [Pseudomonadota bacterium]